MKKMMAITMCMMMLASLFSGMGIAEGSTLAKIDMTKWQYEASDDVYWQVGLSYAADPADSGYETMGVFVPGAYFTAACARASTSWSSRRNRVAMSSGSQSS